MKNTALAPFIGLMLVLCPLPCHAMKAITDHSLKWFIGQAGMSDEARLSMDRQTTVYINAISNGRTSDIMQSNYDNEATGITYQTDSYGGIFSTILDTSSGVYEETQPDPSQEPGMVSPYGETSPAAQDLTGVAYKYVNTVNPETGVEDRFVTQYMTITQGHCPVLSNIVAHNNTAWNQGLASTSVSGVVVGLPSVEIHTTTQQFDVGLLDQSDASNSGKTFLKFEKGPTTQATLRGIIEVMTRE